MNEYGKRGRNAKYFFVVSFITVLGGAFLASCKAETQLAPTRPICDNKKRPYPSRVDATIRRGGTSATEAHPLRVQNGRDGNLENLCLGLKGGTVTWRYKTKFDRPFKIMYEGSQPCTNGCAIKSTEVSPGVYELTHEIQKHKKRTEYKYWLCISKRGRAMNKEEEEDAKLHFCRDPRIIVQDDEE